MNITGDEFLESHGGNIIFSIFYILIFIFAIPGNTLALWTFIHQESTSPSDIFLRHLSVADIFYILILPMRIVNHLSDGHWPFGHTVCKIAAFLFYLNMYCSLYLMSFISLDRFLAVVFPIKSLSVRKPLYAKVVAFILWVIVIICMSPTLISKSNVSTNSTATCYELYLEKATSIALVSTLVAFAIPLTTIVASYVLILVKLRTVKQELVKDKAKTMIILIMINFLLAFLPYHVSRVLYITDHTQGHMTAARRVLLGRANHITSALTCVSAILDPVMYFFMNRMYREKLLKLLVKSRQGGQ